MQPSDTSSSIQVEKLQVASDYPLWRRSMKINFSSKRKMEFMIGALVKDNTDEVKAELWKICNNMLNKDLYELEQNTSTIIDYYTALSMLWEEIYSMNTLLIISFSDDETKRFIEAISLQKEESGLF
ncbi:histone H3-like centromeric protein cid [Bienertia sinuspersici]